MPRLSLAAPLFVFAFLAGLITASYVLTASGANPVAYRDADRAALTKLVKQISKPVKIAKR